MKETTIEAEDTAIINFRHERESVWWEILYVF